jgi:L1 cell adhesion molecule like protein
MRNTLEKEEIKLEQEVKDKVKTTVDENLSWLESNQSASTSEYKDKLKEIMDVTNPIMQEMYKSMAPESQGQEEKQEEVPEPKVDEVD